MRKIWTSAAAGLALVGTAVTVATPADAQRWRGGGRYHGGWHRGGGSGAAVAAGILGLGVGAAIASSNRGYYAHPGYYGYGAPVYYGGPGYYAPPPPYAYGYGCRSDWRWDGWRGRYVRVRWCD